MAQFLYIQVHVSIGNTVMITKKLVTHLIFMRMKQDNG